MMMMMTVEERLFIEDKETHIQWAQQERALAKQFLS